MLAVTAIAQSCGFVLLLLVLPFTPAHAMPSDYLFGALAGLFGALGVALLYHALSVGKMGVVSPIPAVIGPALPLGYGLLRGERLTAGQAVGLLCALVAILLISLSSEPSGEREFTTAGVREAIVAGFAFGGFFIFLSYTHPEAGLHNLVGARVASIGVLLLAGLCTRTDFASARADWRAILACGVLDMTANILYVLATFRTALAIAAVLVSLYPASTVFLARVVLNERLAWIQKAGVAFAFAGVLLISLR